MHAQPPRTHTLMPSIHTQHLQTRTPNHTTISAAVVRSLASLSALAVGRRGGSSRRCIFIHRYRFVHAVRNESLLFACVKIEQQQ